MSVCFYHQLNFKAGLAVRDIVRKGGQKTVFDTTPAHAKPDPLNKVLFGLGGIPQSMKESR